MTKKFFLQAWEIAPIIQDRKGYIATDRIVVDDCKVGYMRRDPPRNNLDSGWMFYAGDEDDEYMSDNSHLDVYQVNTIVNYDPDILPFIDA